MENALTAEVILRTRADYTAAIELCLAEMQRLRTQIVDDQEEIDRLQAETRALLAALQTT